jgi:hypothetical protein
MRLHLPSARWQHCASPSSRWPPGRAHAESHSVDDVFPYADSALTLVNTGAVARLPREHPRRLPELDRPRASTSSRSTSARPADGEIVILHDDTVDRTTDGTGSVRSLTLEQVKASGRRQLRGPAVRPASDPHRTRRPSPW